MRAVQILTEEHRLLRGVLESLDRLLEEIRRDDRLDALAASKILEFLELYADGCHQAKEEEFLIPRILSCAPADVCSEVDRLLGEHQAERNLLDDLRAEFEGAAYADPVTRDAFVTHARAYAALQRQHAAKEEARLFRIAEATLDAPADTEIVAGFDRIDERYAQRGIPGPAQLAAEIFARFGVGGGAPRPRAAARGVAVHPA